MPFIYLHWSVQITLHQVNMQQMFQYDTSQCSYHTIVIEHNLQKLELKCHLKLNARESIVKQSFTTNFFVAFLY